MIATKSQTGLHKCGLRYEHLKHRVSQSRRALMDLRMRGINPGKFCQGAVPLFSKIKTAVPEFSISEDV